MSLRTTLVASFTVLLVVAIVVIGVVASQSVTAILVGQADQALLGLASRGPGPGGPGHPPPPGEGEPFLRPIAEVLASPDGTVVWARPSGFADAPDPLPDVAGISGGAGIVDAAGGDLGYRALAVTLDDGSVLVRAVPLGEVASARASLARVLLVAGGAVLLLGAAATWWSVRRAMRPVDEMVDTATAIAAGDLGRRVPATGPGTELGRLGGALNQMLIHIEEAVDTERQGQERLRRFVADASHELRTPLATISGYAELHRRGGLEAAEEEEKAWERIESESARMGSLVQDLLTLARLGKSQPLRCEEVDVVALAENAAADHRAADPTRPVTVHAPPGGLVATADPERLHQVVVNLLSNVRVHTPPGTEVEIDLVPGGGGAGIVVTDDGPGIRPDALPHVFERFYRADSSRWRRSGGSGLGLAIVDAVVTAHGGAVTASNAPGGGARISIELP